MSNHLSFYFKNVNGDNPFPFLLGDEVVQIEIEIEFVLNFVIINYAYDPWDNTDLGNFVDLDNFRTA